MSGALREGELVLHYRVGKRLGQGGMGTVYKAFDEKLRRHVALKQLRAEVARSERGRERFLREARAAASLNHPSVVAVHALEEHEGDAYIVMEWVDGETLKATIAREPLPIEKVTQLGREVAAALDAAHAAGIVHRDIKPANILVTREGRAKVTDFGIAKRLPRAKDGEDPLTALTAPGAVVGSVSFMSPEQVAGEEVGALSDIFSLGSVLYLALVGELPFERETTFMTARAILRDAPVRPREKRREIPPALEALVLSMLSKSPEGRPTAAEVGAALTTSARPPRSEKAREEAPQPSFARRWAPVGVVLVVGAVFLPVVALTRPRGPSGPIAPRSTRTTEQTGAATSAPLSVIVPTLIEPSSSEPSSKPSATETSTPIDVNRVPPVRPSATASAARSIASAPPSAAAGATLGASCAYDALCASGHCVDGVCCDLPCDGVCEACTPSKKATGGGPGGCGYVTAGEDPARECGAGRACNGLGACVPRR
ncbi:MAG: serine/threonine-protein kinase [Polyangiaceae bacterium]